jgi:5-methylcytosine-specific restriction protein B
MSFSNDDAICREFPATWPIERLRTMTLPDYTATGSKDTFTFWRESRLARFGSIWGGCAFAFGICSRNVTAQEEGVARRDHDAFYCWYRKNGETHSRLYMRRW